MTYFYQCDGFCGGETFAGRPMLTAEFNDDDLHDSPLADQLKQAGYDEGDLVTLCPDCTRRLLLEE